MKYSHEKSRQYLLEAVYVIGFRYNVFLNWGKTIISMADATIERCLSMTTSALILASIVILGNDISLR